jgi:hypothetical protein
MIKFAQEYFEVNDFDCLKAKVKKAPVKEILEFYGKEMVILDLLIDRSFEFEIPINRCQKEWKSVSEHSLLTTVSLRLLPGK